MEPNANSYRDTPLQKICDTKDVFVQETLVRSAYGYKDSTTGKVYTPTEYWASVVLKDTFSRKSDEFDEKSWALLDDRQQPNTVVCNHRGDGKTTRIGAYISRGICFRLTNFILYLQSTQEDAATEMDNIKTELLSNDFIVDVFGRMKAATFEDVKKSFGVRAWFACNPQHPSVPKERWGEPFCFVLPRGAGQRIRGRNIYIGGKRIRPSWVFADDLEDDEAVLNQENRDKLRKWWFGAVMPVVPQDKFPNPKTNRWDMPKDATFKWQPPYRFMFNGTMVHHDALIATLLSATDWKSVRIPLGEAVEQDGKIVYKSLRPNRISDDQLARMAQAAKEVKALDVFYRERLCVPTSRENACWTKDLFQHYTAERDLELQTSTSVIRFIIVDPSKSASQQSDLTGIIAVAVDPRNAAIYIRRVVYEHLNSNDIPRRVFDIAVETNTNIVCPEVIGQQGVVDINFTNEVTKRGLPIQLIWLKQGHTPKGDYGSGNDAIKRWRGQQILPYYQSKEVWHHPALAGGQAEMHLMDYPFPSDWCTTDCLGYIPSVMAELGIVFGKQTEKYKNIQQFPQQRNWDAMSKQIKNNSWAVC